MYISKCNHSGLRKRGLRQGHAGSVQAHLEVLCHENPQEGSCSQNEFQTIHTERAKHHGQPEQSLYCYSPLCLLDNTQTIPYHGFHDRRYLS